MENLEINGYKLFDNEDDAVYVAKSKEDVLKFYEDTYGTTQENCDMTHEEFLDAVTELSLSSESIQKEITVAEETDTGTKTTNVSVYSLYVEEAQKDQGCSPVLWFNL